MWLVIGDQGTAGPNRATLREDARDERGVDPWFVAPARTHRSRQFVERPIENGGRREQTE
jgi:hypothetical protein